MKKTGKIEKNNKKIFDVFTEARVVMVLLRKGKSNSNLLYQQKLRLLDIYLYIYILILLTSGFVNIV